MSITHRKTTPVGLGTTAQRLGAVGKDGLIFSDKDTHALYLYNLSTGAWIEIANTDVENVYVRATWYQSISAATGGAGSIGLPSGVTSAEFVMDTWPDEVDAVLSGIGVGGLPDSSAVYGSGVKIYVPSSGGFSSNGAYTLSGAPDSFPVAFVYSYRCKLIDFNDTYALNGCTFEKQLEIGDILGTTDQVTVTDNSNGTITLSVPDPATFGNVSIGSGKKLTTSTVQASDGGGLAFKNQAGTTAIKILDGCQVQRAVTDEPGTPSAGFIADFVKVYNSDRGFPSTKNADGLACLYCLCLTDNITYTLGPAGSGANFQGDTCISDALAFLSHYYIPPDKTITLKLPDSGVIGSTTPLSSLEIPHSNADRINIIGNIANPIKFDISGATSAPNPGSKYIYVPAGSYTASAFYLSGGSPFIVYIKGSTDINGVYTVDAAVDDGSDIRLTMNNAFTGTTKDGTLFLLPANNCQVVFAQDSNGIYRNSAGTVNMHGVMMKGSYTTVNNRGVNISSYQFNVTKTIINGFKFGIVQNGGIVEQIDENGTNVQDEDHPLIVCNGFRGVQTAGFFTHHFGAYGSHSNTGFWELAGRSVIRSSVVSHCPTGIYGGGGEVSIATGYISHCTTGVAAVSGNVTQTGTIYQNNDTNTSPVGTNVESSTGGWLY